MAFLGFCASRPLGPRVLMGPYDAGFWAQMGPYGMPFSAFGPSGPDRPLSCRLLGPDGPRWALEIKQRSSHR